MNDLDRRFRLLDTVPTPDVWEEAVARRSQSPHSPNRPTRRLLTVGIAFGLFSSATAVVTIVTAIAVVWMLVFFARSGSRHPVLPAALGLLIGGSLSNLVDRVRLGYVTDFIDFRWWPAFDLADSFIVIGVLVLLGALAYAERPARRQTGLRDAPSRPS